VNTYRVTYKNNFARKVKLIEANNHADLIAKLSNRCIDESQIVTIKEGH